MSRRKWLWLILSSSLEWRLQHVQRSDKFLETKIVFTKAVNMCTEKNGRCLPCSGQNPTRHCGAHRVRMLNSHALLHLCFFLQRLWKTRSFWKCPLSNHIAIMYEKTHAFALCALFFYRDVCSWRIHFLLSTPSRLPEPRKNIPVVKD